MNLIQFFISFRKATKAILLVGALLFLFNVSAKAKEYTTIPFCIDCNTDSLQVLLSKNQSPKDRFITLYHLNNQLLASKAELVELLELNERLQLINPTPYKLGLEHLIALEDGNLQLALDKLKEAVEILIQQGHILGIDSWFSAVRNIYTDLNQHNERLQYYTEKAEYFKKHGPKENLASSYHGIAGYYNITGDYNTALSYYLQAAECFKEFSIPGYSNELQVITTLYFEWGNIEKAKEYVEIENSLSNEKIEVYYFSLLKLFIITAEGKIDEAKLGVKKLITDQLIGDPYEALVYLFYSDLFFLSNELDSCKKYMNMAQTLEKDQKLTLISNRHPFEIDYSLFHFYKKVNQLDSAEYHIQVALRKARESSYNPALFKYLNAYSNFLAEQGRYKEAVEFNTEYQRLYTQHNKLINSKNIAYYEYVKKELDAQQEIDKSKTRQNYLLFGAGFILLLTLASIGRLRHVSKTNKVINKEKERSNDLLLNILPYETAEELKQTGISESKKYEEVTVVFMDIKNFTSYSEKISSTELVKELNYCFSGFDNILEKHRVEKIKTVGDAYIFAAGLPSPINNSAQVAIETIIELQTFIRAYQKERKEEGKNSFHFRIGVHTGPLVAGIVGIKKFAYDIWGDTVNIAARMEQNCEEGRVNVSESTKNLIQNDFKFEARGKIEVKGKGEMEMFYLNT